MQPVQLLFHDPSLKGKDEDIKIRYILQRIVDAAYVIGVSIQIEFEENIIHVPDLYRHRDHKGSNPGDGLKVLNQVCEVADHFGLTVETVPYAQTAKMEGLLRCSTLPLRRK